MSKTIEFVERQLIFTKEEERIAKKQLEQIPPNEKLRINALKIKLQTIKNNLIQLQQIKCELEAWEVVKKRLIREKYSVFHSKDCSVHNYTRIYLKEIKEDENTEEYQILKKALEVENE